MAGLAFPFTTVRVWSAKYHHPYYWSGNLAEAVWRDQ